MSEQKRSPHGRVALVTGAGGGIGGVVAREFAARGYKVAVTDLNGNSARETAQSIVAGGGESFSVRTDVTKGDEVRRMIDTVRDKYGRIDAAFNNAGVSVPRVPMLECDDEAWQKCIDVNLTGTWHCMKAEIRLMLEQEGGGCIVNNGSIFAMNAGPSGPYTASKHGVAGLTKSAALWYAAKNVRINAVCPGLIEAGMGLITLNRAATNKQTDLLMKAQPIGRPGTALEVAKAVVWLCSDDASFIHGHLLAVDGGLNAR